MKRTEGEENKPSAERITLSDGRSLRNDSGFLFRVETNGGHTRHYTHDWEDAQNAARRMYKDNSDNEVSIEIWECIAMD